ncbi:MAG: flagellar biosynthesis protein FlhA [Oscillospiraceae bacterium]|nr:flagellar biosynthesis protein FlhA [Oscillospiraceae bacterium]
MSVFVIMVVALIIIPLPTFFLDFAFVTNIAISLMILLISIYIKDALEFSVFPSLLLITTLFRLGLNISSTRQILTNGGNAGQVVSTFGNFVLQGNVVVGFIIFIIIVIVQFLVITKGAERVAEVSARFTLDAMPGKQMAIDADLNAGLIDEQEARRRRSNVQREAEFYGSMDGATKFVKGDSIMSIIITLVNFIGGVIIGMVQGGGSFTEVLNTYSISTVGDGLVSQIPALLISTATGMIVTRSASESSLGNDLTQQVSAQPVIMFVAGGTMFVFALIPGMPKLQTFALGIGLLALGATLTRTRDKGETEEDRNKKLVQDMGIEEQSETEYFRNIDNIYELLTVDAIEMNFGYSLIPLVDQAAGSNFVDRLVMFRKQFAQEMGMVIPAVRLRDDGSLSPNQYVIKIRGEEISRGEILVDYFLALDPGNLTGKVDGIETIEPAYGIPGKWITPDKKDIAEIYGYTVIDPLSVVVTHMSETVRKHAYELLTRQDVTQLLENLKKNSGVAIDDIVPSLITVTNLQKILCNLLREGVPIRDMEIIIETIAANAASVRDVELLTEQIRQTLKRTITRKWAEGGQIKVITLDSSVEKVIINSVRSSESGGAIMNIDPDTMQTIMTNLTGAIKKVKDVITTPIVLTSPVVRIYFSKMLEQFAQSTVVLSYNEIDNGVQIQAVANVTLD